MTTYLSIVGTQVMAVLNPILALFEQNKKPASLCFLATDKSITYTDVVKAYLVKRNLYRTEDISIIKISNTMNEDSQGHPPAHQVLKESYHDTDLIFNVAGGMNFQIVASARQININRCLFLYPEMDCIHVIKMSAGNVIDHNKYPLPEPLDPVELLVLQGTPHQLTSSVPHPLLTKALNQCKIDIPKNGRPLQVGNISFDYVWSSASSLKFLKVLDEKANIDHARDIINFAVNRDEAHELYYREIAVLTNNLSIAKRLREEGGGKITILQKTKGNASFIPIMRRFFNIVLSPRITEAPVLLHTENRSSHLSELYTVLGADITPTMIAVWSHEPKKMHLLYTPADHQITNLKESIVKFKHLLPVEDVIFHPISIDGHEITEVSVNDGSGMEVNITPGTKSQGLFLMLLALHYNGNIFSLKTPTQTLEQIPSGESRPLCGPDPLNLLLFKGHRILPENYGITRHDLQNRKDFYEGLLQLIKTVISQNGRIVDLYFRGTSLSYVSLQWKGNKAEIIYKGVKYTDMVDHGECFERLIGHVMLNAGADDVRVRLRTSWDEEEEKQLRRRRPGEKTHMTDVDVIGRFQSSYYAVSCKSGYKYSLSKEIKTIKSVATLFGRFTIPLFVSLKHLNDPKLVNDVYVFGPKTFTDVDAMKELLHLAAQRRRKTDA